ncbi:hypothetical protein GOP47_0026944 [Adiantum capillus-veneris]|nr:hypothetical protein GOP47_0026423 [Adiantum capillus-veneris]KAI5058774.1 hypothetical protein GOP47_0026944 [Adiantum capillus-veneris]
MGFMSRRVLPVCGSFCVCCPALRSRSRQPVKRYKKLITDIFPKSQDELPNDRKIAKLCEYASKNPLRILKIASSLEQRGYKELRNDHFGSVRVIMAVYTKLFSACKSQMPLFAVSAINLIKTLLDQTRQDDARVLGCDTLFEFAHCQVDGTYIHHLDGLLPSLCLLAEETGEEQRRKQLRSAGLRALSALVWFMGENSHMPSDFNHVVSVIMENYGHNYVSGDEISGKGEAYQYWVKEVVKGEGRTPLRVSDSFTKLSFRKEVSHPKEDLGSYIPSVWARSCIEKIAHAAKEATTTRRFMEPIFHYFDMGKHWRSDQGLALAVLQQILHSVEKSGIDCFLLVVLVKHLDHKSIKQQPQMKADVAKVVANLARQSKSESTVVDISVLSDVLQHLRISLQACGEDSSHEHSRWNKDLQSAIQECLIELARKLGDCTLICETMALTLEKLSSNLAVSRSTIHSLLIIADILASLPSLARSQENFSEALLHQLSLAMVHPDSDTRVGAHDIFGIVLRSLSYRSDELISSGALTKDLKKSLLKSASALNVANVLLGPLIKEDGLSHVLNTSLSGKLEQANGNIPFGLTLGTTENMDSKQDFARDEVLKVESRNPVIFSDELEMATMQLSGDQAALLLSALWTEANMDNNLPANYEAMSKTFNLVLTFSSAKNPSHAVFVRAFQLALSLRTVALDKTAHLSASRQRSLFVVSVFMLTVALKVHNIRGIATQVKGPLARGQVDPFLEIDSTGLRATKLDAQLYGTPANNASALELLASIRMENLSNDTLVSLVLSNLSTSFETELSSLRDELLQMFSPDDGFTFGLDIQLNTVHPWNSLLFEKMVSFHEVIEPKDDLISDMSCTDLPQLLSRTPIHTPAVNVIGVSQLLESALETAGQVAGVPAAATPLSYSAVAMRCEAFGTNARRNLSVWMNLGGTNQTLSLTSGSEGQTGEDNGLLENEKFMLMEASKGHVAVKIPFDLTNELKQTLQLPPVSHYDNFLRAAGC